MNNFHFILLAVCAIAILLVLSQPFPPSNDDDRGEP